MASSAFPRMHPGAIDVTRKVPVKGKPWSGGSGNRKLVFHTIEGNADPETIGWPRDWTRWTAAPHLAMNSDRWPDGDWLYETLPLDVAAYSLRDNAGEDDRFVWQIEIAGQAKNVPTYPDRFYQAVADVSQWFVDEMGVPNVFRDFSCCQYGSSSPCRISRAEMNRFAGFMGHCHFGRGIDTHGDPGRLDVARVRSFMGSEPPIEPPREDNEMPPLPVRQGDGYETKPTDYPDQHPWKDETWKSWIFPIQRGVNRLLADREIDHAEIKLDGAYGPITASGITAIYGPNFGFKNNNGKVTTGRMWEQMRYDVAAIAGSGSPGDPEHNHPQYAKDGHLHPGKANVTHTHSFAGVTDEADQP